MSNYDSNEYRKEYKQFEGDTVWTANRIIWRGLVLFVVLAVLGFIWTMLSRPAALVEKATDPDFIISNYEEFQNMYNACQKLDADLKTLCSTPGNDAQFTQFSKASLINAKRQQMARWVNEYNAKSKMINRQYWKSTALPYQLSEENFPNYNCNQLGGSR